MIHSSGGRDSDNEMNGKNIDLAENIPTKNKIIKMYHKLQRRL